MNKALNCLRTSFAILALCFATLLLYATLDGFWGYWVSDFSCLNKSRIYFILIRVAVVLCAVYLFIPWYSEDFKFEPTNFERFVAVMCGLSFLLLSWLTGSYFIMNS